MTDKNILAARIKFGRKLKRFRIKRGWTQKDLADRSGIHVRHVQRLESQKGQSAVELDTIIKLSKGFKISAAALLNGL